MVYNMTVSFHLWFGFQRRNEPRRITAVVEVDCLLARHTFRTNINAKIINDMTTPRVFLVGGGVSHRSPMRGLRVAPSASCSITANLV